MNIVFIVGPTAAGKSALAMELARKWSAEIVSVDAFQVYRGLDIGTGKPTTEEQKEIPHHLIDIAEPTEKFTVADYLRHAREVLSKLGEKKSIWVGGSGLHFSSLRKGLSVMPASETEVLKQLGQISLEELVNEIRAVDLEWSAKADLKNRRRVERAVAVWRQTGIPISEWQKKRGEPVIEQSEAIFLEPDLNDLRKKIEMRIHAMWAAGWPEEVKRLSQIEGWEGSQSFSALGYKWVLECIRGKISREACLERIILETGQFAKRQLTWFRTEKDTKRVKMIEKIDDIFA
ncbi:MAG: tRNA (adenosine(37)-N6)-dimethylallyltransferase MiaA [Verrucomicrobiota bacterium]